MGIFNKLGETSKGVAGATKNMSEIGNLKRKITYEEERIVEIFADMGRKFYKNPNDDLSPLLELCEDISQRRRRIKKMKLELTTLRGYKICTKCDSVVNGKFEFCGVCGAKLPDPEDEECLRLEEEDYYTVNSNNLFKVNPSSDVNV